MNILKGSEKTSETNDGEKGTFVDPDDEIQPETFNVLDDLKEYAKEW